MSFNRRLHDAEDLILADEDGFFERHLTAKHPGNFFANLDPGASLNVRLAYCTNCLAVATQSLLPVAA